MFHVKHLPWRSPEHRTWSARGRLAIRERPADSRSPTPSWDRRACLGPTRIAAAAAAAGGIDSPTTSPPIGPQPPLVIPTKEESICGAETVQRGGVPLQTRAFMPLYIRADDMIDHIPVGKIVAAIDHGPPFISHGRRWLCGECRIEGWRHSREDTGSSPTKRYRWATSHPVRAANLPRPSRTPGGSESGRECCPPGCLATHWIVHGHTDSCLDAIGMTPGRRLAPNLLLSFRQRRNLSVPMVKFETDGNTQNSLPGETGGASPANLPSMRRLENSTDGLAKVHHKIPRGARYAKRFGRHQGRYRPGTQTNVSSSETTKRAGAVAPARFTDVDEVC